MQIKIDLSLGWEMEQENFAKEYHGSQDLVTRR